MRVFLAIQLQFNGKDLFYRKPTQLTDFLPEGTSFHLVLKDDEGDYSDRYVIYKNTWVHQLWEDLEGSDVQVNDKHCWITTRPEHPVETEDAEPEFIAALEKNGWELLPDYV